MPIIDTQGLTKDQTFALRGYGASEAATICGCGYEGSSRLKMWFEKRDGRQEEVLDPVKENLFWWGNALEPLIAKRLEMEAGIKFSAHQVLYQHPDHTWLTCLIDGITECGKIVDFKSMTYWVGRNLKDGDLSTLDPMHHIQSAQQMACTGKDYAIWACFTGIGSPLKIFTIPRDDELIATVIQLVREFKESVDLGIMPEEFEPGDNDFLKRKFTRVKPETLVIESEDLAITAFQYLEAKEAEKYAKEQQEQLQAKLRLAVGEAERAQIGPYVITRTERSRKGYSVEPTSFVEFRVTLPKERR